MNNTPEPNAARSASGLQVTQMDEFKRHPEQDRFNSIQSMRDDPGVLNLSQETRGELYYLAMEKLEYQVGREALEEMAHYYSWLVKG